MATNTVPTFTNHTGNGSAGPFNIGFNYIDKNEIIVRVNEVLKSTPTHYTFNSNTQITFTSGNEPATGVNIELRRSTNITTAKGDFQDGSVLTETDLDANTNQLLFALQENTDAVNADNLESSSIYLRDGSRTLTGSIVFEGSTKDAHETTLTPIDPTTDRTINIPNISGTLVTTGDTGTVTSTMIANGTIVNTDLASNINISTTGNVTANKFFGDGSGLTGITFDGIDQFLRRDIDDTASGNITFANNIKIPLANDDLDAFPDGAHGTGNANMFDKGQIFFNYPEDTTVYNSFGQSAWIYLRHFQHFGSSINNPELNLKVGTNLTTASGGALDPQFAITTGGSSNCIVFDKNGTNITNFPLRVHSVSGGVQWEFRDSTPSFQINCSSAFGSSPSTFITNNRGTLFISSNILRINDLTNGHSMIHADADAGVKLYYDNVKKFETKSWGSHVFGALVANGDLKANTYTGRLKIGESDEFTIQHDDTDTFIENTVGNLHIRPKASEEGIKLIPDGSVELYYDGTKKAETTADGFQIQDNLTISSTNPKLIFDETTSNTKYKIEEGSGLLQLKISTNGGTSYTSAISIGGVGNIFIPDNDKVNFGSGNDLTIVHDGTDSKITNITGNLVFEAKASETGIKVIPDGAIELYFDGVKKAETVSYGFDVSGVIQGETAIQCNTNATGGLAKTTHGLIHGASKQAIFQYNGVDDKIYLINNTSDKEFALLANDSGDVGWKVIPDGSVELYHDNVKKAETSADGLDLPDNSKLQFGDSQDLQIFHDGTNSRLENAIGELQLNCRSKIRLEAMTNQLVDETMLLGTLNDAVELYYDNVLKFETTSSGTKALGNTHIVRGTTSTNYTIETTATGSATTTLELRGSRTGSTTTAISKIDFTTADTANTSVYDSTMPMGRIAMFKQEGNTNRGRLKIDLNNVSGNNIANVFDLESDGDLAITGTLTEGSDRRLKTDIVTISNALTKVNNLRGVEYTKIASGKKEIGVIAQEVETVFPELVRTGDDEDKTLSVKYGHLTAALIEAVKELTTEVNTLKTKVAALEAA